MKSIVIVGGGTAGWMTASYVKKVFGDKVDITLVESKNVPKIGVGEATFSTIRHFFSALGLKETEWMPECNATYKMAIRFEDWTTPGEYFYHPFERSRIVSGAPIAEWWLYRGGTSRYDQECSVIAALCDAKRAPRSHDGRLFERGHVENGSSSEGRAAMDVGVETRQFPYAYHFDASRLALFLTKYATDLGVHHVLDEVGQVDLASNGYIRSVHTAEHGLIAGDLFVDCTGFRGILLNQALGTAFLSYQDTLPNDRAVALRVPVDMAETDIRPCTTATAKDCGWIWTIPLYGRNGNGYVYSSDYCSPDEAEKTLRDFVGPAAADLEANHIRMRIGRSERSWVRNCVAVGLSSGFVEPLESTGIFFIQNAIEQFVKFFPENGDDDGLRDAYNRQVGHVMDGVREFLILHYYASSRNDNRYWKDAKTRPLPDGLAERVAQWSVNLPDENSVYPYFHGFEPYSYVAMLLGLRGVPVRPLPGLALRSNGGVDRAFQVVRDEAKAFVASLPSQYEYFTQLRSDRVHSTTQLTSAGAG
jgi:tryptophan 6-halogenase